MTALVWPLDRFLRHEALGVFLREVAEAAPDLVELTSIGRSHEGRDLWLVTLTDASTGSHDRKPAHWVDASIHATELTATVAALALLRRLVEGHGTDPTVTRALATRTFYVVPRVNPDGAEAALADRPQFLRSSVRPWPWRDGSRLPGLHPADLDGDGRILTMRIADPNGGWKAHPDEPRLLVAREPDDGPEAGPFWRTLEEGEVTHYDHFTIPQPNGPAGLDLNRNFPAGWDPTTTGAGDHPGSEPEVAALIAAMVARPNICGAHAFHTFGGVLLRPSSTKPDRDLPPLDLWRQQELGARMTALTGYPVHSVYEEFTWDRTKLMSGAADDWAYEHLGVYAWTTEFWDPLLAATGERSPTSMWYVGPTAAQELGMLRWFDEHHPGSYVDWYPFDHPQLGPVELGGWDDLHTWTNPPFARLEAEVAPHADTAILQALAAPCLLLEHCEAQKLSDGDTDDRALWRVRVGVSNTGWLPTTVTAHAAARGLVLPVVAELTLPEGSSVADGPARVELGQLEGYGRVRLQGGAHRDGTPDRALATWLVRAPVGPTILVEVRHPRAGRVNGQVVLGG